MIATSLRPSLHAHAPRRTLIAYVAYNAYNDADELPPPPPLGCYFISPRQQHLQYFRHATPASCRAAED